MDAPPSLSGHHFFFRSFSPFFFFLSYPRISRLFCFFSFSSPSRVSEREREREVIHLRFNVSCIIQANIDQERVFFLSFSLLLLSLRKKGKVREGKKKKRERGEKRRRRRLLFSWNEKNRFFSSRFFLPPSRFLICLWKKDPLSLLPLSSFSIPFSSLP